MGHTVGLSTEVGDDSRTSDVIDTQMPASGVPGVAYAVVDDGEMEPAGARGVLRMGAEAQVTPDTSSGTRSSVR